MNHSKKLSLDRKPINYIESRSESLLNSDLPHYHVFIWFHVKFIYYAQLDSKFFVLLKPVFGLPRPCHSPSGFCNQYNTDAVDSVRWGGHCGLLWQQKYPLTNAYPLFGTIRTTAALHPGTGTTRLSTFLRKVTCSINNVLPPHNEA